jgi:hypothetical protein
MVWAFRVITVDETGRTTGSSIDLSFALMSWDSRSFFLNASASLLTVVIDAAVVSAWKSTQSWKS